MIIHVEIPEPLASQVAAAAKSHATSLEHYVIEAVAKVLAQDANAVGDHTRHPLQGLLADDPDLADRIVDGAYALRAMPLRTPSNGDHEYQY